MKTRSWNSLNLFNFRCWQFREGLILNTSHGGTECTEVFLNLFSVQLRASVANKIQTETLPQFQCFCFSGNLICHRGTETQNGKTSDTTNEDHQQ
jgi:hypothetical protein